MTTLVIDIAIPGMTLTCDLFTENSDTPVNETPIELTEETVRRGFYQGTTSVAAGVYKVQLYSDGVYFPATLGVRVRSGDPTATAVSDYDLLAQCAGGGSDGSSDTCPYDPTTTDDIADFSIVRPQTSTYQDCPIFDKLRVVSTVAGSAATVEWQLLTNTGRAISLVSSSSASVSSATLSVAVKFLNCGQGTPIGPVEATIHLDDCGVVRFDLPDEVALNPGVYQMQIAVISDSNPNRPIFMQKGLLSVERSAWSGDAGDAGPPTINEIRVMLRDNAVENVYNSAVEYTEDEILFSISNPVREWNETPPHVQPYSCGTFPYKFYWMRAIVAELMRIASQHYLRNKQQITAAGMNINDLDKNGEYMQLSELYRREWLAFMEHEKVAINVSRAFGSIPSVYSRRISYPFAGGW